jgi:oligosaccharide repeat unit polymerase
MTQYKTRIKRLFRLHKLYNPIILNTLASVFCLYANFGQSDLRYFAFISIPFVAYLLSCLIITFALPPNNRKIHFNKMQKYVSFSLIIICSLTNILCIFEVVKAYGSISTALNFFGATQYTQYAQEKSSNLLKILYLVNFFTPPALSVLAYKFRAVYWIPIGIFLMIQLLLSLLFGTRIIFITSLFAFIIVYLRDYRVNFRLLAICVALLAVVGISLVTIQSRRTNSTLDESISQLYNYYAKSINNGAQVINHEQASQPYFWTLRPLLAIPFLPKASGILNIYEQNFGALQIAKREDDFIYAQNLGVDPSYNTFSTFGYAYLDANWWGIILVLFAWISIQYAYTTFNRGSVFAALIFPVLLISLTDQLRTYWFFTDRNLYALVFTILIVLLGYNKNTKRVSI